MNAKQYWLHHPTLSQVVGPYTIEQLRDAITAGSFPADSSARADGADAGDWQPVTDLLGMPRPKAAPDPAPGAASQHRRPEPERHLAAARERTAYAGFRKLVTVVAAIKIAMSTLALVVSIAGLAPAIGNSGFAAATVLVSIGGSAVEIVVVVVVAKLLNIVADIADAALQRGNG